MQSLKDGVKTFVTLLRPKTDSVSDIHPIPVYRRTNYTLVLVFGSLPYHRLSFLLGVEWKGSLESNQA